AEPSGSPRSIVSQSLILLLSQLFQALFTDVKTNVGTIGQRTSLFNQKP
ncbi:MAG: hypothetical protein ACI976_002254, partial [Aureispira sp.]